MNHRTLTNFYTWAIKILVLTIPFLSLWIARSLYFPYITGRNFGFRILVEIALAFWIGLMVLDKSYRPKTTWLFWVIVIFTAIVGLADLFGVDPYHSFWSRYERMEGYLMILHLVAYFLILTSVFRTKRDWFMLFNIFVVAGVLVGGYGILQVLGLKEAIQGGDVRIDGTIGNPTYLAAYLLLIIALTGVLFFNARRLFLKYVYGAVIAFNFIVMYFTASRGIALALLISLPLFLILYLIFFRGADAKEKLYKKIAAGLLILIILAPIGLWLLRNTRLVQESAVLSRLASLSLNERTIRARFLIWNMSWQGFLERPVLGWGQENYLQVFSKHFDPKLYDQEPWFDRAHNIVFDWLINAGILGLVAYLAIFVAFFITLKDVFTKKDINKKEGLILIVIPIAYFIQNFFVFDNFNTYVIFFTLLAYVNNLSREENTVSAKPTVTGDAKSRSTFGSLIAGSIALLVMALVIYFVNVKPFEQARGIIESLEATTDTTDAYGKTLATFKKTLALNTFGVTETFEQLLRIATLIVGQDGIPDSQKLEFINFAASAAEKYLERFPADVRVHLMVGGLYQAAVNLDTSFVSRARDHYKTALELSPKKQQIYFVLAENYLRNQEAAKAFELMAKAIELEPENPEALGLQAAMAVLAGRDDLVIASFNALNERYLEALDPVTAERRLSDYIQALEKAADLYIRIDERAKAKAVYEELRRISPSPQKYEEILENLQG